jgi:hypothetical protein
MLSAMPNVTSFHQKGHIVRHRLHRGRQTGKGPDDGTA